MKCYPCDVVVVQQQVEQRVEQAAIDNGGVTAENKCYTRTCEEGEEAQYTLGGPDRRISSPDGTNATSHKAHVAMEVACGVCN
jgi:hypothetical protein